MLKSVFQIFLSSEEESINELKTEYSSKVPALIPPLEPLEDFSMTAVNNAIEVINLDEFECSVSDGEEVSDLDECDSSTNPMSHVTEEELTLVAALMFHSIQSGISVSAFDGLVSVLKVIYNTLELTLCIIDMIFKTFTLVHKSFKGMKKIIEREICGSDYVKSIYVCQKCKTKSTSLTCDICASTCNEMAIIDWERQLQVILESQLSSVEKYSTLLASNDNGDVLCKSALQQNSPDLHLHLLLSTDGGNPYRKCRRSFWPLQAIILDLPPKVRYTNANTIIFGIWCGTQKPIWKLFFESAMPKHLGQLMNIIVSGKVIQVVVKIRAGVFDLPAMSSVLNIKQFNGEFGCPYCCNPGRIHPQTRARIYEPQESPLKTSAMYGLCGDVAEGSNETIFGIKGKSVLSRYMSIPNDIVIDSMHLFYENIFKNILSAFFDSKNRKKPYYMGRQSFLDQFNSKVREVLVPHDFPRFPEYNVSQMKAHDYKHYLLYLVLPFLVFKLPSLHAIHLITLVMGVRLSVLENARQYSEAIHSFFAFYARHISSLYSDQMLTITVHLLHHMSGQIQSFGSTQFTSMFSFESRFVNFKKYMKGTRGHLQQIATKFFLYKTLFFYLTDKMSNCHEILSLQKTLSLPPPRNLKSPVFLVDKHRLFKDGILYHSMTYPRRVTSAS